MTAQAQELAATQARLCESGERAAAADEVAGQRDVLTIGVKVEALIGSRAEAAAVIEGVAGTKLERATTESDGARSAQGSGRAQSQRTCIDGRSKLG